MLAQDSGKNKVTLGGAPYDPVCSGCSEPETARVTRIALTSDSAFDGDRLNYILLDGQAGAVTPSFGSSG